MRRSILLVEDNPDDVFFVSRALRGLDIPLDVVCDGQAAVEFLIKAAENADDQGDRSPSLILLDLNLPYRSGLDVLKWVREQVSWRTVIVIVLTSSTSEADLIQAYELGANSYIIKPSDATQLADLGGFLKGYWFGWNQLPPRFQREQPTPGAVTAKQPTDC